MILHPGSARRRDPLRARERLPGEGEAVTYFWETLRLYEGFASAFEYKRAVTTLIREGRIAEAYVLAAQFDREVREREFGHAPAPAPLPPPAAQRPPAVATPARDWRRE